MNKNTWNSTVACFNDPELLQTWEWGEVKEKFGWKAAHHIWEESGKLLGAALILEREIKLPLLGAMRMLYLPKGPLISDWSDQEIRKKVFDNLVALAEARGAFLLKIEPGLVVGKGEESEISELGSEVILELKSDGWSFSNEQIQFRNTAILDISPDDEQLLAGMKQKTRYNIRLADRRGVEVRLGNKSDFDIIFSIYAETSLRDGFAIRDKEYYKFLWTTFYNSEMLSPLIAYYENDPIAALMLFHFGEKAWYLHGMSTQKNRNLMPTYLLQWEAIKRAKFLGCKEYDLWGAPLSFEDSDPLWGVYRIKKGLGARVIRTIGAYDLPIKPIQFWLYSRIWPRVMDLIRFRGNRMTRQSVD